MSFASPQDADGNMLVRGQGVWQAQVSVQLSGSLLRAAQTIDDAIVHVVQLVLGREPATLVCVLKRCVKRYDSPAHLP
jgi:hypothetical protein